MTSNRNIVSKIGRIPSAPRLARYEIPFTLPGLLGLAAVSPPWRPRETVFISAVRAYLSLPGAGTTLVTVNVNGAPIDMLNASGTAVVNISFLSGVTAMVFAAHTAVGPSDSLTVALVSATAPATGLTVIVDLG